MWVFYFKSFSLLGFVYLHVFVHIYTCIKPSRKYTPLTTSVWDKHFMDYDTLSISFEQFQ